MPLSQAYRPSKKINLNNIKKKKWPKSIQSFHHSSCSNFLLAARIVLNLIPGQVERLSNQPWLTLRHRERKKNCSTRMRSDGSLNVYGWHYWNPHKDNDTRLFNNFIHKNWNRKKVYILIQWFHSKTYIY